MNPLSYTLRPTRLDDIYGQDHLIGENKILTNMIKYQKLVSIILYGPPGSGKTTIASVLVKELHLQSRFLNAVSANKKDLEAVIFEAKMVEGLVVVIDEVHRLNKDKQDILLPHVESGLITLIGVTSLNPYHVINSSIRSRCHLLRVDQLSVDSLKEIIKRGIAFLDLEGFDLDEDCLTLLASMSNGDARFALNKLEVIALTYPNQLVDLALFNQIQVENNRDFDLNGDHHYNLVSALQKSIRGSDVDAALYYLGGLILGQDLDSIARRLKVIAYEDIGLASPEVVDRVNGAILCAYEVGFPEAQIPLAFAVCELALSPKSNRSYMAMKRVMASLDKKQYPIPEYLHQTPTTLSKEQRYSNIDYEYKAYIQYLPNSLKDTAFYQPLSNSSQEKAYNDYYHQTKQIKKFSDLSVLKQIIESKKK